MHTVEESVVMFEGRIWIRIGDDTCEVGPEDTAVIPPHTAHAWGNAGPGVARMLWVWGGADPFTHATYLAEKPPALTGGQPDTGAADRRVR
jgi:quercetin dioxygenase-like cupin family protein